MNWVLFVIVSGLYVKSGTAITSQEFGSLNQCQVAARTIKKEIINEDNLIKTKFVCVPKSMY